MAKAARRQLHDAREKFVSLWGQMGTTWGIPRTMAQVHALLFVTGAAGLVYEILWMKELTLLFGSDARAASATLAGNAMGVSVFECFGVRVFWCLSVRRTKTP